MQTVTKLRGIFRKLACRYKCYLGQFDILHQNALIIPISVPPDTYFRLIGILNCIHIEIIIYSLK